MSLLLKINGAGFNVEVSVPDDATILTIKEAIYAQTGLALEYQRLLYRGKSFDYDSASAVSVGIADRTKLMLMRSPAFARDEQAIAAIEAVRQEIDALEAKRGEANAVALDELSTQLCCKLDAVDVGDSSTLRSLRRAQLKRCEQFVQRGGDES